MLTKLKLELEGDPKLRHGYEIGSILQGYLLKSISPEYANSLHESMLHPYSQFISETGERIIWELNTLDKYASDEIIQSLLKCKEIILTHRKESLSVKQVSVESRSYEELIKEYYLKNQSSFLRLKFCSPTSFKQNGKYCIYPTARLIFQNLMRRFDQFCTQMEIFDRDLLDYIEENVVLNGYKMRSVTFPMEGVKIPSFLGEVKYKIYGPQQMVNLLNFLAQFGSYAGVGIKTGMGMGGMEVIYERSAENG